MSTDVQTGQGGEPSGRTFKTRRTARRRITKNGNSITISIPVVFRSRLNILPSTDVLLTLYEEEGGFFVKPILPSALGGRDGNT